MFVKGRKWRLEYIFNNCWLVDFNLAKLGQVDPRGYLGSVQPWPPAQETCRSASPTTTLGSVLPGFLQWLWYLGILNDLILPGYMLVGGTHSVIYPAPMCSKTESLTSVSSKRGPHQQPGVSFGLPQPLKQAELLILFQTFPEASHLCPFWCLHQLSPSSLLPNNQMLTVFKFSYCSYNIWYVIMHACLSTCTFSLSLSTYLSFLLGSLLALEKLDHVFSASSISHSKISHRSSSQSPGMFQIHYLCWQHCNP